MSEIVIEGRGAGSGCLFIPGDRAYVCVRFLWCRPRAEEATGEGRVVVPPFLEVVGDGLCAIGSH